MIKTLEWTDEGVRFIDQTKLPLEETYITSRNYQEVAVAIRDMIVRGAPAIGVAAAMGIALGVKQSQAKDGATLRPEFDLICATMGKTRPTAVNLFWAIRRMSDKFDSVAARPMQQIKAELVQEAQQMYVEDIAANQAMGRHGATLMPSSGGVLTQVARNFLPPGSAKEFFTTGATPSIGPLPLVCVKVAPGVVALGLNVPAPPLCTVHIPVPLVGVLPPRPAVVLKAQIV